MCGVGLIEDPLRSQLVVCPSISFADKLEKKVFLELLVAHNVQQEAQVAVERKWQP